MDLNLDMSVLSISHKKRRLSGLIRGLPPGNEYLTEEAITPADTTDTTSPESSKSPHSRAQPLAEMQFDSESSLIPTASSRRRSLRATNSQLRELTLPSTSVSSASTETALHRLDVEKDFKLLKKIYLDKRVKKTCPSLETIFETPNDDKIMSGRKFKRFISFQELQKNKTRKRPLKAKHVSSSTKLKKKNKVTMDALMEKLNDLDQYDEGQ